MSPPVSVLESSILRQLRMDGDRRIQNRQYGTMGPLTPVLSIVSVFRMPRVTVA